MEKRSIHAKKRVSIYTLMSYVSHVYSITYKTYDIKSSAFSHDNTSRYDNESVRQHLTKLPSIQSYLAKGVCTSIEL